MIELVVGLFIFFAVHSTSIVNDAWRNRMAARLGEWIWKGLYALIALIGLGLIVHGYGILRQDPIVLYRPPTWLNPVAMGLLLPVFPLLLAAYLPGLIRRVTAHPMLWATVLWSAAHLLINGKLSDVLLFGAFLLWAVADLLSMRRRTSRPVPNAPASSYNDAISVVVGLLLYGAFVMGLHTWLIGVPPVLTG